MADVHATMSIFSDEVFGPVVPVVIFDESEEALALANASPYGLEAAIHSADTTQAFEWAGKVRSGMVHIDDQTVNNEYSDAFWRNGDFWDMAGVKVARSISMSLLSVSGSV